LAPCFASSALVYVWAEGEHVVSRFFFMQNGAVIEDPGTGSACANLGGWFVATKRELPFSVRIAQGELTGRPCKLLLHVDDAKQIFVTGDVIEIGRGEIDLP
jgi:trans-2,3-dihydro-3-hydroxyanthranilate isomerase